MRVPVPVCRQGALALGLELARAVKQETGRVACFVP